MSFICRFAPSPTGPLHIGGVRTALFNWLLAKKNLRLNIIPHTLNLTNLKNLKVNDVVNVELDIFGKYIYKYTT